MNWTQKASESFLAFLSYCGATAAVVGLVGASSAKVGYAAAMGLGSFLSSLTSKEEESPEKK